MNTREPPVNMLTWGDREIGYALERVPRKTLAITVKRWSSAPRWTPLPTR